MAKDQPLDRLINKWELETRTSLDITTIYRKMKAGTFPQPIRIGKRRVAWKASDVQRWQDGLPVGVAKPDPPPKPRRQQWRDELRAALVDGAINLKDVSDIDILHEVKAIRRQQKKWPTR
jgi:prophage regulatory protein